MRLSEVEENNSVVITKVLGHGSFRRRIAEMGFVPGKEVTVVKNAPLRDPVEYQLLGYNISLRRAEAFLIEVITSEEATDLFKLSFDGTIDGEILKTSAREKGKIIHVALAGNPNCGKTTLFNRVTNSKEHVGNYSGVTVDSKIATFDHEGYTFKLVDLPGTYSLTTFSPDELFTRNYIIEETPDIVLNVIDASNLERNLFLTSQLIDMDIKVVIALNMYDDFISGGARLKDAELGKLLGVPLVPTTASKGTGLEKLFDEIIEVYEDRNPVVRHIHINYGEELERSIHRIRREIRKDKPIHAKLSSRYLAIRLLEKDPDAMKILESSSNYPIINTITRQEIVRLESRLEEETPHLITDAKYGFIAGALRETFIPGVQWRHAITEKIDYLATHRIYGYPIFLLFMFLTFFATFRLGAYPMHWISEAISTLSLFIRGEMAEGMLKDLITDGIINGVGSIIIFLPNILILFFFTSLMEDTGYMARAAFIMDKLMHKIGLHGRSFIPMVMGFGCNVPAIMATRTIRNRSDRLLTMLIIPFMSCSARLPVYIVLISAFFTRYPALVLMGLYLLGIILAIVMAKLLNRTLFRRKETPFVMELPPYRMPVMRNTLMHMWDKAGQYLKKIGGTILVAVILIWALEYFPRHEEKHFNEIQPASIAREKSDRQSQIENSYLGQIGKLIEPIMRPLGFDWRMDICLLAGIPAKEIVVSTMGVLFETGRDNHANTDLLPDVLKAEVYHEGPHLGEPVFNQAIALSLMVFVLLYFPCIAVLASIKRESRSARWSLFAVFYTSTFAWLTAFAIYRVALLFI